MKDLSRYVWLCQKELDALQITYDKKAAFRVNTRAIRRWGACVRRPDGSHEISIAQRLLRDDVPDRSLQEIIHHELLHTIPGTKGHGPRWKSYAARVNRAYGYSIARTKTAAELGLPEAEAAGQGAGSPRRQPDRASSSARAPALSLDRWPMGPRMRCCSW